MIENSLRRNTILGLFVLLGLVFLAAGILSIGNLHSTFSKKLQLVVHFKDVNGLQKGNNIWFSGVKIGTVKDLQFEKDQTVKVTMNINESAREYLRKDALVKIGSDGLIGNRILIIYGGTAKAEAVADGDTLGTLKTLGTDDILELLQENNRNLLAISSDLKQVSHKLASGEGTIGKLLTDESLFESLKNTATVLNKASYQARDLMFQLAVVGDNLNKKGTLVHDLLHDTSSYASLQKSVGELEAMSRDAAATIAAIKVAATDPKSPLGTILSDQDSGENLKNLIENLEKSSAKLNEDLTALQGSIFFRKYFRQKRKQQEQTH